MGKNHLQLIKSTGCKNGIVKRNYIQTHETFEKWTSIFSNLLTRGTTPVFALTMILLSFYKYYILGEGKESFSLFMTVS